MCEVHRAIDGFSGRDFKSFRDGVNESGLGNMNRSIGSIPVDFNAQ